MRPTSLASGVPHGSQAGVPRMRINPHLWIDPDYIVSVQTSLFQDDDDPSGWIVIRTVDGENHRLEGTKEERHRIRDRILAAKGWEET